MKRKLSDDGLLLRVRDECDTGHRLLIHDDPEHFGAALTIAAGDTVYMTTTLDLADIECVIAELTRIADRHRRDLCPWCDSLGMVDGVDGPEFCDHHLHDV